MLLEYITDSDTINKSAIAVKVLEMGGGGIEGERSYIRVTAADASSAKQAMCYCRNLDVLLEIDTSVIITHFHLRDNIVILNRQTKVYR